MPVENENNFAPIVYPGTGAYSYVLKIKREKSQWLATVYDEDNRAVYMSRKYKSAKAAINEFRRVRLADVDIKVIHHKEANRGAKKTAVRKKA